MIYKDMKTPSANMRLSQTKINEMTAEQYKQLYQAEDDAVIKEQAEINRAREEHYTALQENLATQIKSINSRTKFLETVKEAFLAECIMKLYSASTQAPMTKRDKVIAKNMVNNFIKENGAGDLITSFATKNLLLSEMARITQKYYDRVVNETWANADTGVFGAGLLSPDKDDTRPADSKPWEVQNWDLPTDIANDFYDELIKVDVTDASKLIKDRVADSIQNFIDTNAIAKMEYEDIINQAQEKIEAAKDEAVIEEYSNMAKRRINEMKLTRPKNIFNVMVESLTRKSITNDDYKDKYIHEGTVDMNLIVDDTSLIYTMLEMVNTTNMIKVDAEFISEYVKSLQ